MVFFRVEWSCNTVFVWLKECSGISVLFLERMHLLVTHVQVVMGD